MQEKIKPMEAFVQNTTQAIEKIRNESKSDEEFRKSIKKAIEYFTKMETSCDDILKPVVNIALIMLRGQLI